MISFTYAADQIGAVWRTVFGDADEMSGQALDQTTDGVFRSFSAILLASPFAVVIFLAARSVFEAVQEGPAAYLLEAPLGVFLAVYYGAYLIDWVASLAMLVIVARMAGLSATTPRALAAFNWGQVVLTAIQAIPAIIVSVAGTAAGIVWLPFLAFSVFFLWRIFRRVLLADATIATAILVLLLLVSIIFDGLISSAAGLLAPPDPGDVEAFAGAAAPTSQ